MISNVKREILNGITTGSCCSYAFLNSLFSNAKLEYSLNKLEIDLPEFLVEKTKEVILNFYPKLKIEVGEKFVINGTDVEQLILDAGLDIHENEIEVGGINESLLATECCETTYVKALFLISGNFYYVKDNNEKSKGYSIEFLFKNYAVADDCKALMKFMGLKIGSSKRGNNIILYIKDSETIYNLFVKLGAVETAIEIQNSLLIREMRNDANRQGNCFDANLNKTLTASREQVKAIDYIIKNYGIDYLDESLQETALLRLGNPEITLNEMKDLYSMPITRAGLKYKLDKIINIYNNLIK